MLKPWFVNFALWGHLTFKKNITYTPPNYLSFTRGKSLLHQMLFDSLYEVSRIWWDSFFKKIILGGMSEWRQKKFRGEWGLPWMMSWHLNNYKIV